MAKTNGSIALRIVFFQDPCQGYPEQETAWMEAEFVRVEDGQVMGMQSENPLHGIYAKCQMSRSYPQFGAFACKVVAHGFGSYLDKDSAVTIAKALTKVGNTLYYWIEKSELAYSDSYPDYVARLMQAMKVKEVYIQPLNIQGLRPSQWGYTVVRDPEALARILKERIDAKFSNWPSTSWNTYRY